MDSIDAVLIKPKILAESVHKRQYAMLHDALLLLKACMKPIMIVVWISQVGIRGFDCT
jgi:hypothetical protein